MSTALMVSSGVLWTLTYVLIIRQSFRDHTYGMPLAALCANLAWELIFSVVYLSVSRLQAGINIVWLLLDLVILVQVLRYGPREQRNVPLWAFFVGLTLGLATAFAAVLLITVEFHDWTGAYAAFSQNLMMSILFVAMLVRRNSLRGQGLGIAVSKLLGTACATLAFVWYVPAFHGSVLLLFLGITTGVYDLLYVGLVYLLTRLPTLSAVFRTQQGS